MKTYKKKIIIKRKIIFKIIKQKMGIKINNKKIHSN